MMLVGFDLFIQVYYVLILVDQMDFLMVNIFFVDEGEVVDCFVQFYIMLFFFGMFINGFFIILVNEI